MKTNSLMIATALIGAGLSHSPAGAEGPGLRLAVERAGAAQSREVVQFWEEAGPAAWFAKDAAFDAAFRERFARQHEAAARGALDAWQASPEGALALLILLDQYPRNAFRDSPRMYATDEQARAIARRAVAARMHERVPEALRVFFVLPFGHSEELADQDLSVALAAEMGERNLQHARHHREIVRRFGRFPHRNLILGRDTTAEEAQYLAGGGYQG